MLQRQGFWSRLIGGVGQHCWGPLVVVIALSRAIVVVVIALLRAVVAAIARHCAPLTLLAVCNSRGVPLRIIAHH